MLDVLVFHSNGCPNCRILKKKLDEKGIVYQENNSVDNMIALGIDKVPVLQVDDRFLQFNEAIEYIENLAVEYIENI